MTPSEIRFTAKPSSTCTGCLFDACRSTVCHEATAVAKLRGLPDCDAGYVYAEVETDERQTDLFEEHGGAQAVAAASALDTTTTTGE